MIHRAAQKKTSPTNANRSYTILSPNLFLSHMTRENQISHMTHLLILILTLILFIFSLSLTVGAAGEDAEGNPFTPKAYLIRYWNKEIRNNLPKPKFLMSKASPLNAVESVTFSKLVATNGISSHLPEFCSSANLLCFPELGQSLEKHDRDSKFAVYQDKNFTNYGTKQAGALNSFKNYSESENIPVDSFRRYSRDDANHADKFSNYASDGNVVDQSFNSYAAGAAGGTSEFETYADSVNVPHLQFSSYSDDSNSRAHEFSSYSENANAGDQAFKSYAKLGNGVPTEFNYYGTNANVVDSDFFNYDESDNGGNSTFKNYGVNQNNPQNNFKNYGTGSSSLSESFANYRNQANVGDDSFSSYAKNSDEAQLNFVNYGKSFNEGTDKFTGYGQDGTSQKIDFKGYGVNNTFKEYVKVGISFSSYTNVSLVKRASMANNVSSVKRWVEPGKFFRESMLKEGKVMPMPDIRDKMPKRSFLPRLILSKLPFSTSKISELKQIFKIQDDSTMDKLVTDSLHECERAPSRGETKRCVGSVEDMIDFATSILGRNIAVRSTENTNGSKKNVLVGSVNGINGGRVTQSVSCHQSLFPYLLYYCHSVPKVRVYEADLLDAKTKAKINHGVAICHLDTSAWSVSHGAFMALGSVPGRIEVCHWIFESDMTWTIAA